MIKGEKRWREDVERDLQALHDKRANHGIGWATYMWFRERFAERYTEGRRLGILADDDLLYKCLLEGRGGFKL